MKHILLNGTVYINIYAWNILNCDGSYNLLKSSNPCDFETCKYRPSLQTNHV